ncbi:hypothetical protein ACFVHQ_22360 [Actinomycetes bacterium NPDC127524]
MEVVVFTAGSGCHTGADKTLQIGLDGAIKSMKASEKAGVKRYSLVSAVGYTLDKATHLSLYLPKKVHTQ